MGNSRGFPLLQIFIDLKAGSISINVEYSTNRARIAFVLEGDHNGRILVN